MAPNNDRDSECNLVNASLKYFKCSQRLDSSLELSERTLRYKTKSCKRDTNIDSINFQYMTCNLLSHASHENLFSVSKLLYCTSLHVDGSLT